MSGRRYQQIGKEPSSSLLKRIVCLGSLFLVLVGVTRKYSSPLIKNGSSLEAKGDDDDDVVMISEQAPSFSVKLLDGSYFSYDADARGDAVPMIIVRVDASDPYIHWMLQDTESMHGLSQHFPSGCTLVFVGADTAGVEFIKDIARIWSSQRPDWKFAAEIIPSSLSAVLSSTAFLSPRYRWETNTASGDRLDCFFEWCDISISLNITTKYAGDACSDDFVTRAALGEFLDLDAVIVNDDSCDSVTAAALRVFHKAPNVAGVFVSTSTQEPIGDYTSDWYSTFATTITQADAMTIMQSADDSGIVSIDLTTTDVTGYFVGVQYTGALYNLGYRLIQDARYLAWEGVFLEYLTKLEKDDKSFLEIPIFELDVLNDMTSNKIVDLPPFSLAARFETMQVVTDLTCAGDTDSSCPKWDHCITLLADCFDDDSTSRRRTSEVGGADNEFIRYVTPFRRNVGKWESDRSPLLPLFYPTQATKTCNVTGLATGGEWRLTTSLRLSNYVSNKRLAPTSILPIIFDDYDADATSHKMEFDSLAAYNANKSLSFTVSNSISKILLVATISGHGDCEFESTSHHYQINDKIYSIDFFGAGTMWGCDDTTYVGEIPNQAGTSNYGRDGWCDGAPVQMHSFDITDAVSTTTLNNLTYSAMSYGDDDKRWYASVKRVFTPDYTD